MTPVSTPHLDCFSHFHPVLINQNKGPQIFQHLGATSKLYASHVWYQARSITRNKRTKCSRPGFVHLYITALTGHFWNHISLHMDTLTVKRSGNMATFIPILYMIEQKIYYFQQTWRLQYRLILPATAVHYRHLTLLFTDTLRQVFFPFFHTFLFIQDLFCRLLYISLSLSH